MVKKGDIVKVGITEGRKAEGLWVKVIEVKNGMVKGTLENQPLEINKNYGDIVKFRQNRIRDIWKGKKTKSKPKKKKKKRKSIFSWI